MTLFGPSENVYEALVGCQAEGRPAVLAIIVAAWGSTPQKTGAKMLVKADGTTVGTVGGGAAEAEVIRIAREVRQAGAPRLLDLELTLEAGYLCGGRLQVYLEPVASPPRLVIVGAGHVGLALAALAAFVGYRVTLIDDREKSATEAVQVEWKIIEDYGRPFAGLDIRAETAIVIATRGHHHDLEALAAALRTPAAYVGLLGSVKKKGAMAKALKDRGFPDATLIRVHTPVGLALGALTPEEIAVSIVAQLIAQRRNHVTNDFGPAAGRRLIDPDGSAEGALTA